MSNTIVRYLQVAVADHEPQNINILWLKPVPGGFSFYWNQNGIWKLMKLMNDAGTDSPEDDTPWEGGGGGQLGPDTVGSQEIINDSIKMEDLNKEVKDRLDDTYVQDRESLYINGTKPE